MRRHLLLAGLILGLAALAAAPPALAKTLIYGAASEARTLDPYIHAETPTNSMCFNIYDCLGAMGPEGEILPGLATRYENPDPKTWVFHLRQDVKFHDGSPLTAEDVKFSIERCKTWPGSGWKANVAQVAKVEVVDPYTVKITTKNPYGLLNAQLARVMIMSKAYVEKYGHEHQSLKPLGSGPYVFKEWIKGDHLTLAANEKYWGGAPRIKTVVTRPLTNDATRVAALLAGDVQLIDDVPVRDVDRLKANAKLDVIVREGLRVIFLHLDQLRPTLLKGQSPDGKNPFQDVRVRRAVNLAINVEAIVKHIQNNLATVAAQMYPSSVYGYDETIKKSPHDLKKAKELLKEAGYDKGFSVTLDTPNDRYVNDEKVAQAIAADLAKVGIKVTVNATPKNTYFPAMDRSETSFCLLGWACGPPDAARFLDTNTHTVDKEKGYGRYNYGRYSNPKVDQLIEASNATVDAKARLKAMVEAQQIFLLQDQAYVPLYFQADTYAKAKNLKWKARYDHNIMYNEMDLAD